MRAAFAIAFAILCSSGIVRGQLLHSTEKPATVPSTDAAATLVVFNESDLESPGLATFYAEQRGIPKDQVIGLKCSIAEEISREEYDRTIAEPLRRAFTSNFWWNLRDPESPLGPVESNKIRFLALIRGMPLRIAAAVNYPGDKVNGVAPIGTRNEAAVDSELTLLAVTQRPISGAANNPFYRSFTRFKDAARPEIMLVCRLDGPTAGTVRRMITDAIATEREGLAGFAYIDARGIKEGGYEEGDAWLQAAAALERRRGRPVVLDSGPDLFPAGYPMQRAAIYYGWYSENVAGALAQRGFKFARGAIAVHIHSFSAQTVRDPQRHWVAPLVDAGATATLGSVYEPYLTLTPHLDVFHDRLRSGLTFAEAAYMSQRVLSWMTTCVGDPLYRPFHGAEFGEERPTTGEWAAYRKGAELWTKDKAAGKAALKAAATRLKSGIIAEGAGHLASSVDDRVSALAAFEQARGLYRDANDVTRVAIHEIFQLRGGQREVEAQAFARKMIETFPKAPAVAVFQSFLPAPPAATPR
jgi:uncharacterized protein (TIGR03790 family)